MWPGGTIVARGASVASLARLHRPGRDRGLTRFRMRFAGEKIGDRLVSLFDPDARPIRRGKLAKPNEFGYLVQLTEVTSSTKRGTVSLMLPPKLQVGALSDDTLLPLAAAEVAGLGLTSIREGPFDPGFHRVATTKTFPQLQRIFIAGSKSNTGSKRTRRRLACYRVGCEARISQPKREYRAGRSRLKGAPGAHLGVVGGAGLRRGHRVPDVAPPTATAALTRPPRRPTGACPSGTWRSGCQPRTPQGIGRSSGRDLPAGASAPPVTSSWGSS